jgi:hypothetical protein
LEFQQGLKQDFRLPPKHWFKPSERWRQAGRLDWRNVYRGLQLRQTDGKDESPATGR